MMGESHPFEFEAVFLPHLDEAYNLARWLMQDVAAAEDVVQEAALRALTYFHTFKGTNARAWSLQIVRNVAYSALRNRRNAAGAPLIDVDEHMETDESWMDEAALIDPAADPEALLVKAQEHKQLNALLAELPVRLRECLVLHELSGASYKEIAAITETPIGTVMSRLWRARRMLIKLAAERWT